MKNLLKRLRLIYRIIKNFSNHVECFKAQAISQEIERQKPNRTDVINFLLAQRTEVTKYLEIGVRNPRDNFDFINATEKYGVDPGVEFADNPVQFKMTSDEFFDKLQKGDLLHPNYKFDLIFIDGLHLADQVNRDILNALACINDNGFVVLHDCNPPTEWHARENYYYHYTPAAGYWNGTTWKAFFKQRCNPNLFSCCVDTDWGVGIISKKQNIGNSIEPANEFFEFSQLQTNRQYYLNLKSFDAFKQHFENTDNLL